MFRKLLKSSIAFLLGLSIISSVSVGEAATQKLEVHYINVGQGDATYIEMPDGSDILIDSGRTNYGDDVVRYLQKQEKNIDLEYAIATHPDADHVGGFQEILKSIKVKKFYYPHDVTSNTKTWKNVISLAKKKSKLYDTKSNTTITVGGVVLRFIQPQKNYPDSEPNDDSAVILLKYKNNSFMFTGDIESGVEKDMLKSNLVSNIDVLKIAHHGSNGSSTYDFLKKADPEYALISVGKNSYGHPSSRVIKDLGKVGSKYWRTDKSGNVIVKTNGTKLTFSTSPTTPAKPSQPIAKTVYWTPSGKSYHTTKNCPTLSRSKVIYSGTLTEAKEQGKSDPCDRCN